MARIAGRSNWVAWPVGVICAAVVAALAVLSTPMVPPAVQWVGDALRGPTYPPVAGSDAPDTGTADTAACRALYTSALWSELTARTGGDPLQDASAPAVSATTVVAALEPAVRTTCTWTAMAGGTITTTLADVDPDAVAIADAALTSQGFACSTSGAGVSCSRTDGDVTEEITLRDGAWLSSRLDGWHPNLYSERIGAHLWPG